ncbi:glutathione S-transferase N-terminal domain-containing protein [Cupriavidus taiwanensis]|uniref:glutathione S-transferase N-terminal domain-containing protein n=1 Tax=Cupriavidus taiwanensis TaxID=164546 RepID=UPI000E101080|nr:glutathione S-transferase N-terminal domain-containing protein [Cupriavidus taiwanensis]SOY42765.1 putative S-transferase [Cupriavidus taiwanensis]SOY58863.1 putative S-transferase [Cupriavidus taiwanensis]SOY80096.1 putative S-transferase [Cupriavidus taiwanensis]SOZ50865.1 putative S-transferase [Cupriavidus taiwanensis]SOZ75982.1 putative S-transferase [Cupriavidus taiwanensis]
MIDLYFWSTPNGYKVSILLEELRMPYNVIPVHIGKGQQFAPEFLAISPNNKIPAIVDHEGPDGQPIAMFESGAIMMYLGEKSGYQFMPQDTRRRYEVLQWLMFQMGGVGPMLGQAHHFRKYAPEKIDYAIDRYTGEARRLYTVIDRRLADSEYLAGDYSIADMATYPWLRAHKWQGQDLADFPNLERWYSAVRERPAVQRGIAVLAEKVDKTGAKPSGERWDNLFGKNQFTTR